MRSSGGRDSRTPTPQRRVEAQNRRFATFVLDGERPCCHRLVVRVTPIPSQRVTCDPPENGRAWRSSPMSSQIRSRIVAVAIALAVVLGVSVRAVTNWVSADALGDVAVSFDSSVQVFDNANVGTPETITASLTGTNGGLAFDASLNLLVANTAGNQLVKIAADATHTTSTVGTQPSPAALAFAADGSVYVASLGGTIRRFDKNGTPLRTFTVATDSTSCIGIDLSPDQKALFMVSG